MSIVQPGECWIAEKPLDGMKEAPKVWGEARDKVLRDIAVAIDSPEEWLVQSVTPSTLV